MSTTYFIAALKCPVCGSLCPDDTSTMMVSHLLDDPGISVAKVGDRIPQSRDEIAEAFYRLRPLPADGPLVLLQEWWCRACQAERFAHVVFDQDGCVSSIEAVPLTRAALDAAHLGSARFPEVYERLLGEPICVDGAMRPEFIERLRARLTDNEGNSLTN
jgi:hypothetical protein